jgi:Carboxypeptidase regulatory-like domain
MVRVVLGFRCGALLICASLCFAVQTPAGDGNGLRFGSVQGQVTDPSGAVVPGASVTAIPKQGSWRTATTDGKGIYTFENLPAGVYTIAAQSRGFAEFAKPGVRVVAGQAGVCNIRLVLSTAQAAVQVTARPVRVSVSPENNSSAVSISGSDLRSLANDPDALAAQIQEMAGPSAGPNGAEIYIDGFLGGDMPPKSAIREIRVNQNPFSALYDRLGYGRVEILTKPGAETFHGSGFMQGNSSAFNAESPFLAGARQPPYHTLLYGGDLGGPMGKKASFFLAAERRNISRNTLVNTETLDSNFQPSPFLAVVPTPDVLNSVTPRVDYQLTPNNTLMTRYHYFGSAQMNRGVGTQSLPSQGYNFTRQHHFLQVSDSQVLGPRTVNDTRFQYLHFHNVQTPQDTDPTLEVLGTFTGGGSSAGLLDRSESHYELQNLTTLSMGRHYVQFGGFVRDIRRRESSNAGFNGTFIFDSLANYQATEQGLNQGLTLEQIRSEGYGPDQFNITAGSLIAGVNRMDGSVYAQDDFKARPNVTLSYGLRFESENVISDHADWAPRLGLAWGLGRGSNTKTVVRAGFGIFYDRFDDDQMIQAARLNGVNQVSYVAPNPAFFPMIPPIATLATGSAAPPTVYRIAPNLRSPYAMESAISLERQVTRNATVSVTYVNSRGEHRFFTNDINAPLPGTYNAADPSSGIRPLGGAQGNIYEYVSDGIFRQTQLIANFRVKTRRLSMFGYYTYNDAHSDAAGVDSFPADPWNVMADYGRAAFDVRNRVFAGGSFSLPLGIQLYPMLAARSGLPFSITLGSDWYGTGIHNGRPAPATEATPSADLRVTPYGSFDINLGSASNIVPPNIASGPAAFAVNLRVSRTFGFGGKSAGNRGGGGEHGHHHHHGGLGGRGLGSGGFGFSGGGTEQRYALTISVLARNLFNNVNLGVPVGDLNSPLFGRSLDLAGGPYSGEGDANRRIDLRLSFDF